MAKAGEKVSGAAPDVDPLQPSENGWRHRLPSYPMVISTLALAVSAGGFYKTYFAVQHSLEVGSISVSLDAVPPATRPTDAKGAPPADPVPLEVRAVLLNKGNRTEVLQNAYVQLTSGARPETGSSAHNVAISDQSGPLILKPGEAAILKLPARFTPQLVGAYSVPSAAGETPPRLHLYTSVVAPRDVPSGRWIRIGRLSTDAACRGLSVSVEGSDWIDLMNAKFRSQDPLRETEPSLHQAPPRPPPPPPPTETGGSQSQCGAAP